MVRKERPVTREDAEALMLQIQRAIAAETDQVALRVMDTELFFEKSSDGYTVRAPGESSASRYYVACSDRPILYPTDIPFIADEPVMVSEPRPDTTSVIWWAPRDPDALVAELEQQCVLDGWRSEDSSETSGLPVVLRSYEKNGLVRRLLHSVGMVTLLQLKLR